MSLDIGTQLANIAQSVDKGAQAASDAKVAAVAADSASARGQAITKWLVIGGLAMLTIWVVHHDH